MTICKSCNLSWPILEQLQSLDQKVQVEKLLSKVQVERSSMFFHKFLVRTCRS
jgi:hypothetical protein